MTDNTSIESAKQKNKDTVQRQPKKMNTSVVKDVISKGKTISGSRPDQITLNPVIENARLFKLISNIYDRFNEGIDRSDTHKRDQGTDALTDIYKNDTPGQQTNSDFSKTFKKGREAVTRGNYDRKEIDLVPRDSAKRSEDSKFFRQQSIVKRRKDVDEAFKDVFEDVAVNSAGSGGVRGLGHVTGDPDGQSDNYLGQNIANADTHDNIIKAQVKAHVDMHTNSTSDAKNKTTAKVAKEEKEVWNKSNPKKTHTVLTPSQKAEAKARAKAAGRPYPNLIDNMAVAKEDVNNIFADTFNQLDEISAELVGRVNKIRWLEKKPSKTKTASQTLSHAVRKAWLKSKVGIVKEEECSLDEELEVHELIEEIFEVTGTELYEDWGEIEEEAEHDGHKVSLGKPFLTPDGPKKRAVYVKNDNGNVVKVNFGDPNMRIKKNIPARRRSFRARHHCENPGPRTKARYWSCKAW